MVRLSPSILSANQYNLQVEIEQAVEAGVDMLHVDVMDGHFVPNITMGPIVVEAVKRVTSLPIDVHLMIEHPDRYILDFIKAGADRISVHVEACAHLDRTIQMIREAGIRAGAVLNPATPLSSIEWTLEHLDFVLLMSVNPGFGGQSFIANSLKKISDLRSMIDTLNLPTLIQVDGGVNTGTIETVSTAGTDVFVAGSAIFGTDDYAGAISSFRDLIKNT